jgi:hypothetical protein
MKQTRAFRGGGAKLEHIYRTAITVRSGVQVVWGECHKSVRRDDQANSEKYLIRKITGNAV